uniref:A-kinase anchoring protein 1 n=1 Tax=Salvator merianae TaxID=96440 RepID=A0A8D0BWE9_SALMN
MALRFRTLLPFAIPGVLALIGWWWFSSRKRERVSHDRRGLAGLEGKDGARSAEDNLLPDTLSSPLETKPLARPTSTAAASSAEPRARAQGLSSSKDPAVVTETTGSRPSVLRGDGQKLEAGERRGVFGPQTCNFFLPRPHVANDVGGEETPMEGKLDPSRVGHQVSQMPPATAVLPEALHLEKSEEMSKGTEVQSTLSEETLQKESSLAAGSLEEAAQPTSPSAVPDGAVSEGPPSATKTGKSSSAIAGELETVAEVVTKHVQSASSEFSPGEEPSGPTANHISKRHGCGEVGYRGGAEAEQLGGISLDKGEVEKIEQVALHIISNVIRAATEEVLSGSAGDVSDRICQIAGRVSKPPEKPPSGASGQAESIMGTECSAKKAVEVTPLLEENVHRHTMYSSHLTHGVLVRPGHGRPRDSPGQLAGTLPEASNHDEEFEDAQTVTEDSGCSACTSEDGVSAEDLLKSTSLPALEQHSDLLDAPAIKDSQHKLAFGRKPPSPPLGEPKLPYSNGLLKEECPHLRHEQSWQTEADGDNSGGSDVNSMDSVDIGCVRKNDSFQKSKLGADSKNTELVIWEIEVPKHLVGRLIGKQGRYVSFLKQTSGAKIYISTLPYTQDFQICHIEGSQQNVDKALTLIGKKFKDLSLTNIYAPPPPPLPLHSLPMTSWLMLPDGVTVEVIVVNQVNAGHLFVQQHTHPTFHVLRSLDQQMYLCYSQPGIPTMPTPVEVGVVCAAPGVEGAWWRAQVVAYFRDADEVEIRYVDYGGYERVKIETLRQIRSDFVTLPFQGAEVLLDNVVPLPDDDHFSTEADTAVGEMTRGTPLLAQVTNYDSATGLPLIQLWSMIGDELVSINRTLVERGFAQWIESY